MFISNLCSPLFVFKRGFLGSLFIVFVKVIILVIAPLVHCWAGGRHFFHLKELTLLVVIMFWGVGGVFGFRVGFLSPFAPASTTLSSSSLFLAGKPRHLQTTATSPHNIAWRCLVSMLCT